MILAFGLSRRSARMKAGPSMNGIDQVGDDQPHFGLVLRVLGQSLRPIGRLDHPVAMPLQCLPGHPPYALLVIHQQNQFSLTLRQGTRLELLFAVLRCLAGRQVNLELCALSHPAVDLNKPAVALYDADDRGQSQPGALPTSLVVKKGSKILSRFSGGMPVPVSVTLRAT